MTNNTEYDREAIEAIVDPIARLRVIMKRLLDPGGCPWDREQTHETLKQYMIEEAHEVVDAIEKGDDAELCEELGDVALQVIFHSELAERENRFRLEDVYTAISRKLIDRHPHVFGSEHAPDSETVLRNWEQIKKVEKQQKADAKGEERASVLDGVPGSLPSLQKALRLQQKASKIGFDWEQPKDVAAKVREEVEEFLEASAAPDSKEKRDRMEDELGDLLFSLVNLSRFLHLRPEDALRKSCAKFNRRFRHVEQRAEQLGRDLRDMTLPEMDQLWDEAKRIERSNPL